jgi:hypothetical protein
MHLRLHVLFQHHFAVGQNLLNVRPQLACGWVYDLEFLLNTQGEHMIGPPQFLLPRARPAFGFFVPAGAICQDFGASVFHLIKLL